MCPSTHCVVQSLRKTLFNPYIKIYLVLYRLHPLVLRQGSGVRKTAVIRFFYTSFPIYWLHRRAANGLQTRSNLEKQYYESMDYKASPQGKH